MAIKSFAGIDLAALPINPTGIAVYDSGYFECHTLYKDDGIIDFILCRSPEAVAVDAPLSLPYGRCCFDDECCGPRTLKEGLEADACAAALTAYLYNERKCRDIRGPDVAIVIPL